MIFFLAKILRGEWPGTGQRGSAPNDSCNEKDTQWQTMT